ncbi:MAG: hypothetical protein RBT35_06410 [Bacteroidales bacterium]|jgi:hypothetical protein|nr:hypothetical protein [Bacteroidales bacterium]
MKKLFIQEKAELLKRNRPFEQQVFFTEELICHLPELLKKYLRVSGYMNMPVPLNANVYWSESFLKLSPERKWGKLETMQFNSVRPLARVSYMKFSNMPVSARDLYRDGYGEMNGKLFNIFKVVFDNSKETAQSALITVFCEFLFIPGYILLDNVKWETHSENSVRGLLSNLICFKPCLTG